MKGNFHVQFLGEGVAATSPPYPTVTDVVMSEPSSRFWRPGTKVAFAVRSPLPKPMPDCRIGALSGSGKPDFAIISARGR